MVNWLVSVSAIGNLVVYDNFMSRPSIVSCLVRGGWWVVGSNEDYAAGNIIKAHSLLLSITAPSVQSGIS